MTTGRMSPKVSSRKRFSASVSSLVHAERGGLDHVKAVPQVRDGAARSGSPVITPSASLAYVVRNLDAEFVVPDVPAHVQRIGADVVVVEDLEMANVAQEIRSPAAGRI